MKSIVVGVAVGRTTWIEIDSISHRDHIHFNKMMIAS